MIDDERALDESLQILDEAAATIGTENVSTFDPDGMDRLQACKQFLAEHPEAEYGPAHVVVADYNLEDGFIYRAIYDTAARLAFAPIEGEEGFLWATLKFLYRLRDLPMPEGWNDE